MNTRSLFLVGVALTVLSGCQAQETQAQKPSAVEKQDNIRIVLAADVDWQALNPARGAASPRAGTLWGDRTGEAATGFLARFAEGFSSPAHIHNVTYRAVVIEGEIHNDDPGAASQWMGPGSFWTQPAGESHITAARGPSNLALVEIDHGPYLVRPPDQAFDDEERPINVDASNLVWLPATPDRRVGDGADIAHLWGRFDGQSSNGSFLRLPPGFRGKLTADGDVFHAVVIRGEIDHAKLVGDALTPGSYFGAEEPSVHLLNASETAGATIYIRSNGRYRVASAD